MSNMAGVPFQALADACGPRLLVVHVHIPKTGGTSISELLQTCSSQRGMRFAYGHHDNFLAMTSTEQARVSAIDAHMGYGIHMQPSFPVERRNCTFYVTMSRPYASVIWSALGHLQSMNAPLLEPKGSNLLSNPWNFGGAIAYQLCCWSDSQHTPDTKYDSRGHLRGDVVHMRAPIGADCPTDLHNVTHCAVRRLCSRFHHVGRIDRMDHTLHVISSWMRCKAPSTATHSNQHSAPDLREANVDALLARLHMDNAYADAAILRLAEQVADGDRRGCG
jgi:hypothetical protein